MTTEEDKEQIIIPDENGEEHLFEILFTFDVDDLTNSYMTVVPAGSEDQDDEVEVFAFRYEEEGEDYTLYPIETDAEWEMVEEMLNTFADDTEDNE